MKVHPIWLYFTPCAYNVCIDKRIFYFKGIVKKLHLLLVREKKILYICIKIHYVANVTVLP